MSEKNAYLMNTNQGQPDDNPVGSEVIGWTPPVGSEIDVWTPPVGKLEKNVEFGPGGADSRIYPTVGVDGVEKKLTNCKRTKGRTGPIIQIEG